jgi:3-isopropylmalate dehydrogenase
MILSAVMMLEHLNEDETAGRIRKAVMEVVAEGKARAYDMLKLRGTPEVVNQGAASTRQMADAIIAKLK